MAIKKTPTKKATNSKKVETVKSQREVKASISETDRKAKEILFKISTQAYEYSKQKTETMTALLSDDTLALKNTKRAFYHTGKSRKPLYVPKRDTIRLLNSGTPLTDLDEAYAKDYARIVHSHSFRRLQGKSQLIPAGENEFFRTRLTHSLEVAEIARRIGRNINREHPYFQKHPLNLDLISCAGLLHDIGHPPFGHSGEEVLNELMSKPEYEYAGFEGNAQTLRIITKLENRLGRGENVHDAYKKPRGLNLTTRTLASILKYDTQLNPIDQNNKAKISKGYYSDESEIVKQLREKFKLKDGVKLRSIECQIMDIADDIAYSAYDLEDTMEAGLVTPFDLISLDDGNYSRR